MASLTADASASAGATTTQATTQVTTVVQNTTVSTSVVVGGKAFHFKSPSGNIQCRLDAASVNCLLMHNTWRRLKPRPAGCDVDWIPTDMEMYLDTRTGRWKVEIGGCRGDVGPLCYRADPCSVLRYGRALRSVSSGTEPRGIRCTSAANGVTCTKVGRRPGFRGFRISRQGYAVF